MASGDAWQCPDCGRRFPRPTKEHSCSITSVESHLSRTSPDVRAAFEELRRVLSSMGPFETLALKTMLTFRVASNFAGVTLTKSRLDLGFFLSRELTHPRIQRVERISRTKIAHHVYLASASDVDAELTSWLRESYEMVRR